MGLFDGFLKMLKSDAPSQPKQGQTYVPQKRYTLEELVIYEQEQSGEIWHGVPLFELSKIVQSVYHGKYAKVDEYGFLEVYYTSKSNKTTFHVQCNLDENKQLKRLTHNYYPGQCKDAADYFIEEANKQLTFR